ncbi:MAG: competence/damage-inducible protein A [Hyphomicrobiaceae bacterium]|nr:competence/damage-inducible protein A [Hyphomicrobiaceae bacterium]
MTTSETVASGERPGAQTAVVTAAVLVIGDEILSGRTKDRNIGTIAEHLTSIGIDLREARIVGDRQEEIVEALNALRARYDYVLTTGGIGPTHDDITADAIAAAFGVPLLMHQEALDLIAAHAARRGVPMTEPRRRMARIPQGGMLVRNAVSAAPGFVIGNVIVMAGVPNIMEAMLTDVTPQLRRGRPMLARNIDIDRPEGDIAEILAAHQLRYPGVPMGSYPHFRDGRPQVQIVLRSRDETHLDAVTRELADEIARQGLMEPRPA